MWVQAARVLQLEGFGLAFLLQHFLDIHPDKRYQLADWRIRPLPSEMIKYAREDTHYLLYLHDLLKVQLASTSADKNDAILQVFVCL
jgi:exosome complex exonuclease RRP6